MDDIPAMNEALMRQLEGLKRGQITPSGSRGSSSSVADGTSVVGGGAGLRFANDGGQAVPAGAGAPGAPVTKASAARRKLYEDAIVRKLYDVKHASAANSRFRSGGGAQEAPSLTLQPRFAGTGLLTKIDPDNEFIGAFLSKSDFSAFPYWSPTGRKPDEALDHATGLCFIGLLPWMHMLQNPLDPKLMVWMKNKLNLDECYLDDQCAPVMDNVCLGQVSEGISLKPVCLRAIGTNSCACGVSLDWVTHPDFCHPDTLANFPPRYAVDYGNEDEKKMGHQIYAEMEAKQVSLPKVTVYDHRARDHNHLLRKAGVGVIAGHIFPGVENLFTDFYNIPLWSNDPEFDNFLEKKKKAYNFDTCAIGILPYVKCHRRDLKAIWAALTGDGFACFRDEDCFCGDGCAGPLWNLGAQTARFKPFCWTKGINKCVCALVSDIPTKDRCTMPMRHVTKLKSKPPGLLDGEMKASIFYGGKKDEEYSPDYFNPAGRPDAWTAAGFRGGGDDD